MKTQALYTVLLVLLLAVGIWMICTGPSVAEMGAIADRL